MGACAMRVAPPGEWGDRTVMHPVDLRVRNLETGERLVASFASEVDAIVWLHARPDGVEVLGVATEGLSREMYATLRSASRPLDVAEHARIKALDAADEAAEKAYIATETAREEAEVAAHREAMRTADPDRVMQVNWTLDGGFRHVDSADPRVIPEIVCQAVRAWIAERETWVEDRGQRVVEATVEVWPGPLPRPGADRVRAGGTFIPAPKPVAQGT